MATGRIYPLQENGSLQEMSERSYVSEERLQDLLVDYPDLLAGAYHLPCEAPYRVPRLPLAAPA